MRKLKFRAVTSLVQGGVTCEDVKLGLKPKAYGSKSVLTSGQLCGEGRTVPRRRPAGRPAWVPTLALLPLAI